ncbi:MAG: hypothetical protein KDK39_14440 [Leptospiraceae bacterium]|nr:hypothetical protein [Leptospiraceae bacterium]
MKDRTGFLRAASAATRQLLRKYPQQYTFNANNFLIDRAELSALLNFCLAEQNGAFVHFHVQDRFLALIRGLQGISLPNSRSFTVFDEQNLQSSHKTEISRQIALLFLQYSDVPEKDWQRIVEGYEV